jgi:uridine kinase
MSTKEVAEKIRQMRFTKKPIVIAIDGFGGAGKTTFAKALKAGLTPATVVEVDDFYLFGIKSDADKSNFDRYRLVAQILEPLKQGLTASYQKSIDKNNPLSEYFDVPKVDYLILEGVSSFHPDIEKYIDYKIWLEVSADEAKNRMMNRDKIKGNNHGEEFWNHHTDSYQAYKDRYQPESQADLTITPSF